MFLDSSFATSLSIMAFSSAEKVDCGRLVLDRRQNFLIRGNHLQVANGLGCATSPKMSASVVQVFLKVTYQRWELTYRFFNVFQRLYHVLSVRFFEKLGFF